MVWNYSKWRLSDASHRLAPVEFGVAHDAGHTEAYESARAVFPRYFVTRDLVQFSLKHIRWPVGIFSLMASFLAIGITVLPSRNRSNAITNVAVSSTGRWLAAGTRDGLVAVCDLEGGTRCTTLTASDGELNDLQFSPSERFLAIANNNIRLIEVRAGYESSFVRKDNRKYGSVRFNTTGSELLTINSKSEVEIINIRSRTVSTRICCSSFYGEVAFFADATRVANAGHWPRVWMRNGQAIKAFTEDREYPAFRPIAVDEKAQTIFMGSQDGRIYAWSLIDFTLLKRSPALVDYVDTIALVPKPELIAYCGFGKSIHLWRPASSRMAETLNASSSSNVVALPDVVSLLFGTDSGGIQIWNLENSPYRTSGFQVFR